MKLTTTTTPSALTIIIGAIKAIVWDMKQDVRYYTGNVQFLIKDFKEMCNQNK
jgi:hypothetical protein